MNDKLSVDYKLTRPALKFHGGKWQMGEWIVRHFPEHTCYVEPFGGGASVLIRKQPVSVEVYNDISDSVVNFFKVLRDKPQELIRAIQLTPYSRKELDLARPEPLLSTPDVERARRFYVRAWQGRGGGGSQDAGGWRYNTKDSEFIKNWNDTDRLFYIADRLKHVYIENQDALTVIDHFDSPSTLFYLDPPYVQHTRYFSSLQSYNYDYSDKDHRNLSAKLHIIQGMAIISCYPSMLYDEMYDGWTKIARKTFKDNMGGQATELLLLSPNIPKSNVVSYHEDLPDQERTDYDG